MATCAPLIWRVLDFAQVEVGSAEPALIRDSELRRTDLVQRAIHCSASPVVSVTVCIVMVHHSRAWHCVLWAVLTALSLCIFFACSPAVAPTLGPGDHVGDR